MLVTCCDGQPVPFPNSSSPFPTWPYRTSEIRAMATLLEEDYSSEELSSDEEVSLQTLSVSNHAHEVL